MSFVHLRVRTEYSLVDSIIRVNELASYAAELRMPAVAVTDYQNIHCAIKFYTACLSTGVKPIIGAEVIIEDDLRPEHPYSLVILCQNLKGYRSLCALMSKAQVKNAAVAESAPHIKRSWLSADCVEGMIALSAGQSGNIGHYLCRNKLDQAADALDGYQNIFGDRFYLELSRDGRELEAMHNKLVLDLAQETNTPVVATHHPRFLLQDQFDAHELKVCIQSKTSLSDSNRSTAYTEDQYFKSHEQMSELFSDLPGAIQNTLEIAKRCNLHFDIDKTHMPAYPMKIQEPTIDDHLVKMSQDGLAERFEGLANEEYSERLNHELNIIRKTEFAGYFLIVADIIGWAKSENIPVGPGRGSGAGSLVAYCLKITDVDPIEHDLLFERFLNPERVSPPDFDIDICIHERERVIEYVAQRYGKDRVAQIVTYNTMAAKAAVRFVGRAIRPDYLYYDALARMIPDDLNITLSDALEKSPELKKRHEAESRVTELFDFALQLEGMIQNIGKHPAGLVIAPSGITDFTAIFLDGETGGEITHFDKYDVESIGLVKFDFLGLKTLTIIDETLKSLKRRNIPDVPQSSELIPKDDPQTYQYISTGSTIGVFQLESKGMQRLILSMQPSRFDDLVALLALFRPGPLQNKMDDIYIENKTSNDYKLINDDLKNILESTYGVILYQEQVMQIAQIMSGYSLGEADILRWAMGKKVKREMEVQRIRFVDGAQKNGYSHEIATQVYDLIESFGGYGFNKSHSVAYALLAYRTGYLKTHYCADFLSVCMTIDNRIEAITKMYSDAVNQDITIVPPDINQSEYGFKAIDDRNVLYGLGALRQIGHPVADAIVAARESGGKFTSVLDFCQRVDLSYVGKAAVNALICAGSFDKIEPNRAQLCAYLDQDYGLALKQVEEREHGQMNMFGSEELAQPNGRSPVPQWSLAKKLREEYRILGLYASGHPLEVYKKELRSLDTLHKISELESNSQNAHICGWVSNLQTIASKKGGYNVYFDLKDLTGEIFVTIYSETYSAGANNITNNQMILVSGTLSQERENLPKRFVANAYFDLQWLRSSPSACLVIELDHNNCCADSLLQAKRLIESNSQGKQAIDIRYQSKCGYKTHYSLGDDWRVNMNEDLINSLKSIFGESSVCPNYTNVQLHAHR